MPESILLSRPKSLKGELTLPPDSEYFFMTFLMASLSRGDSELLHYQESPQVLVYQSWFQQLEVPFHQETESLVIQGKNEHWRPQFKPLAFEVSDQLNCNLLWVEFLTQSEWNLIQFKSSDLIGSDNHLKELYQALSADLILNTQFDLDLTDSLLSITPVKLAKLKSEYLFKDAQTNRRNLILLRHFLQSKPCSIQEPYALNDSMIPLMRFFGVEVDIDRQGTQELSELEKRLARLRGIKTEKRAISSYSGQQKLSAAQVRLPACPNIAAALSVLGSLTPRTEFILKNISVNPSRSGVFTCLRRLGYQVEILRRKERQGDAIGDLSVKFSRDRVARKLSSETMQSAYNHYALIATSACYAEGESILRDLFLKLPFHQKELHVLASNLKQTGAEIGEFDEGIVIRGREECDSGAYDGKDFTRVNLALYILCLTTHGQSEFFGLKMIEDYYPSLIEAIQTLQVNQED